MRFTGEQKKNEKIHTQSLPPNIEELFTRFALGVCTLTKTEYIIFHYYMEGYEIAQIPEIAFISMSTVKKHNRNIYEKLKVSSYNELMLYLVCLRDADGSVSWNDKMMIGFNDGNRVKGESLLLGFIIQKPPAGCTML